MVTTQREQNMTLEEMFVKAEKLWVGIRALKFHVDEECSSLEKAFSNETKFETQKRLNAIMNELEASLSPLSDAMHKMKQAMTSIAAAVARKTLPINF